LDLHFVKDDGARKMLRDCGWEIPRAPDGQESLWALVQWIYLQYEYAEENVSILTFPEDVYASPTYLVVDPEGYEKLPKTYASNNDLEGFITYNTRVQHIKYDLGGGTDRAYVIAENTEDASCTGYFAQRVISTVTSIAYNEGLIAFDPELKYPPKEYNPFDAMKQYIRIYYEFANGDKFWDDSEYIISTKEGGELAIHGTVRALFFVGDRGGIFGCHNIESHFLSWSSLLSTVPLLAELRFYNRQVESIL
jgi:hypothetical protein